MLLVCNVNRLCNIYDILSMTIPLTSVGIPGGKRWSTSLSYPAPGEHASLASPAPPIHVPVRGADMDGLTQNYKRLDEDHSPGWRSIYNIYVHISQLRLPAHFLHLV